MSIVIWAAAQFFSILQQDYPHIDLYGNDKDPWIASFWKIISEGDSNRFDHLLGMLEAQPTIELFYKLSQAPPIDELEKAYYSIFFNRTCFSGIVKRDSLDKVKSNPIGGKEQKSKWKVDCRYSYKKLTKRKIDLLPKIIGWKNHN